MSNAFSPEDLFSQMATGGFNGDPAPQQTPTFQSQAPSTATPAGTPAAAAPGAGDGQPAAAAPNSEIAELKAMLAKQNETIAALQAQQLGGAPSFQDQHQQGFGQVPQRQAPPANQPAAVDPEVAKQQLLQKFYEDPLAVIDQFANMRAQQLLAQHVEPLRAESTNTSVENFLSEQRNSDGIYNAVEPEFRKMMNDRSVQTTLAKMPAAQRREALTNIYNAATGVAYRSGLSTAVKSGKLEMRAAPSYSAGYVARTQQQAQSNSGYDEATQMAYERLVASGVSPQDATEMLKDGE